MKIIDVHGAHVLDFERFHLDHDEVEESKLLGYSVLDCTEDIAKFLNGDVRNITTILPPPAPIFKSMTCGGKFDFDLFPFHYENVQLMQVMTFLSKLGLSSRAIPYFGFDVNQDQRYKKYLEEVVSRFKCGLKFHALAMQKPISSLEDSVAMELASAKGLSVLVHTGIDSYSDPRQLIKLAKKLPQVNFCGAHLGCFGREFLEAVSYVPNLFTDTCILSALLAEVKKGDRKHVNIEDIPPNIREGNESEIFSWMVSNYSLEKKILFGSDVKWTYHVGSNREKEIVLACRLEYPSEKKEEWMYSNARNFLKIN